MKKLAVFVEGYTEFFFVQRLINEVVGYGRVRFELAQNFAGRLVTLKSEGAPEDVAEIFVMICNCGSDGKVKSAIIERAPLLRNKGYQAVIGLRDIYPRQVDELAKIQSGLDTDLSYPGIELRIFLAVVEVEAWFLNEYNHYLKVSPVLTRSFITAHTGFDPVADSAETNVRHPAGKLKEIYSLVNEPYNKKQSGMHRMISLLDFDNMYLEVRSKCQSFDDFVTKIEDFVAPAS